MRKISLLAISALALAGTMMVPVQAQAAPVCQTNKNVVVIKGNNLNDIKDQLSQYGINSDSLNCWSNAAIPENCNPDNDNTQNPEIPETPETPAVPETPETPAASETPETEAPETEEPAELSFAEQVVQLVNAERAKAGLAAVTLDKTMESAALVRAKETEVSFSHTRPNGSSFSTALTEAGVSFKGSGENIAYGQKTPEDVMNGWMNSSGHRANILNSKFTKIGVGYYQNAKGTNYWTQLFAY